MSRELSIGTCESCNQQFGYWLSHCGFGNSTYAYCDLCGKTAVISLWNKNLPSLPDCPPGQHEICSALEPYLLPCECGGTFKRGASPRCPNCNQPLSAERAASYIELNAPGANSGWRWQRNWSGLYAIIVAENWIEDNLKDSTQTG
jgi:hypothetical protein